MPEPLQAALVADVINFLNPSSVAQANDSELVTFARECMLHAGAGLSVVPRIGLPPLYELAADGEWQCRIDAYTVSEAHAWIAREVNRCRNLTYFATHWVYTQAAYLETETPPGPALVPQWPFVLALLDGLSDPTRDLVIEKSRDMLASWLCMVTATHDLLFRPEWGMMDISWAEDLVDDGGEGSTVASLHGKVRYIYENLPPFLRAMPLFFKHRLIRNPLTGAHLIGFSSTKRAGRGPKWKRAFLDELAWVEDSEMIMASVSSACPMGKVAASTPLGKANAFYRLKQFSRIVYPPLTDTSTWEQMAEYCDSTVAKHTPLGRWQRYTLHWTLHPEKDRAWYEARLTKGDMTIEKVAQELNISYEKSALGRVYPKFIYDVHVVGGALSGQSVLEYDPRRPIYLCMDFNHDPLVWEIVQPHSSPPLWRVIGEICRRNAIYEDAVNEFVVRFGSAALVGGLLSAHTDWADTYGIHGICTAGPDGHQNEVWIFGDATGSNQSSLSRQDLYAMTIGALRNYGWRVRVQVPEANPPILARIETMNDALMKRLVVCVPQAQQLIKDCESGIWNAQQTDMNQTQKDDDSSGLTRSHASSALGYMLVRQHRVASSMERPRTKAQAQDIPAMIRRWGQW